MHVHFSSQNLFDFIDLAGKSTYASNMPPLENSERKDFIEYAFQKGEWSYLDSFTGHTKSAGQEIVRYKNEIVWANAYCGGMTEGNETLAASTFDFLKTALSQEETGFQSLRGPSSFAQGEWKYQYAQDGNITNFSGYEEIFYEGKLVFFHRAIGGTVIQN